ncbi:DUF6545 domain-containing protein [Amycolatopsis sp. CA-230715]|uniref:DUF6545 domain-containing protein n=1 Tax=Amycolatopsis sp. CA-230715 TaxID=2745196 RepID=UPI003FA45058
MKSKPSSADPNAGIRVRRAHVLRARVRARCRRRHPGAAIVQCLAGEGRAAAVEACAIIAAPRNHTGSTRPSDTPPPPPAHSAPDIDAETSWLEQVAVALDDSPIVGSFR